MANNLLDKSSIILTPTAYNNGEALCVKPSDGSGDFDFSRNSAATRVNAQGLVENVQILSSNLVQNGDFSEEGTEEVSNGSFTNGSTDWSLGGEATIGENKLILSGDASTSAYALQNNVFSSGKTYKCVFDVTINSGLGIKFQDGLAYNPHNKNIGLVTTSGIYTFYFTSTTYNQLVISRNDGAQAYDGSITNISVKEVLQDWTATNANIYLSNNQLVVDDTANLGFDSRAYQTISTTSGKTYKLNFNRISTTSVFWLAVGSGNPNPYIDIFRENLGTDTGLYELEFVALSSTTTISLISGGTGISIFDDVSVIEITDDTNLPRINYEGFSYQDALGSEQIVNGDFSNGSANWGNYITGSSTIVFTDVATLNIDASNSNVGIYQENVFTSGKQYKIVLKMKASSSFDAEILETQQASTISTIGSVSLTTSYQDFTFYFTATGSNDIFVHRKFNAASANQSITIDNVSVKEYLGQEVVPDSGCGSWLFESQSTNLITQSELFSDAYWTKSASSITSDAIISPDGTLNADKLVENTSNTSHHLYSNIVAVGVYTLSVFVKKGEREYVYLYSDAVGKGKSFNLTNGTIDADIIAPPTSAKIDNYGNGWYRCSMTITANSGAFRIGTCLANGNFSYQGDGTSGVYIWGAMLEQNSFSTSYIPTSGSTVTRNQDLCTNGGSLASINSTEGTLYFEGSGLVNGEVNRYISLSDNTSSNRLQLIFASAANRLQIGGTNMTAINYNSFVQTDNNKIAYSYSASGVRVFVNGVLVGSNTDNASFPTNTLTTLDFALWNQTSVPFQGKTKALAVWKEALSDSELQSLTTI